MIFYPLPPYRLKFRATSRSIGQALNSERFTKFPSHKVRVLLTTLIVVLYFTTAFGQSAISRTEIIIIGTIHSGNKLFNHRTLFEVLKKNKPDIILWEQSTKFKRVFGLRTATFLKMWEPGIEQLALQKYSRLYKDIPILPFDTIITSRSKYLKSLREVNEAFYDRLSFAKKSVPDSIIYADFVSKHNNYYSFIDSSTLSRINKADIIDQSRDLYLSEETVLLPLGKKYISDSSVVDEFNNLFQFWNARNAHMVNQIQKYSKQFAGKKIIILTGLNHRYYLQDKLNEEDKPGLSVIEFVE